MTNRIGLPALLPFFFALLAGCSDGPLGPGSREGVASVAVSPTDLSLEVGASASLTATPLDRDGVALDGLPVAWTSTDTLVAIVSPAGLVSARGAGSATIRASSAGKSGTVAVTVTEDEPTVAWILITPSGGTIPQAIGTARQLGVVARAADGAEIVGRAVSWSSSDPTVATISATGLLQAHAAGTTTIVALVDGKRDSTLVSVPSLIARIELDRAQLALAVGDSWTISARVVDAQGGPLVRPLMWSSSNVAVATVDATGRVVATGAGSALITATSEGKSATMQVTVRGTEWRLADMMGAPLPAILYTTTIEVEGVEREARWELTGGTLRFVEGGYRLRLHGRLLVDGREPVPVMLASDGVVAYDVFTGAPMLFEGDEWFDREPRFRTRMRADGAIELDWSREPGERVVPLGFGR
jgi:uncharacterized protein YjdB